MSYCDISYIPCRVIRAIDLHHGVHREDKFRIQLFEHGLSKLIGKKDVIAQFLPTNVEDRKVIVVTIKMNFKNNSILSRIFLVELILYTFMHSYQALTYWIRESFLLYIHIVSTKHMKSGIKILFQSTSSRRKSSITETDDVFYRNRNNRGKLSVYIA